VPRPVACLSASGRRVEPPSSQSCGRDAACGRTRRCGLQGGPHESWRKRRGELLHGLADGGRPVRNVAEELPDRGVQTVLAAPPRTEQLHCHNQDWRVRDRPCGQDGRISGPFPRPRHPSCGPLLRAASARSGSCPRCCPHLPSTSARPGPVVMPTAGCRSAAAASP
jgi:hypothetical protein